MAYWQYFRVDKHFYADVVWDKRGVTDEQLYLTFDDGPYSA